jgi:hypothetical protein
MSEKPIDKRVLADLREWIGVGSEKISDNELWKESGSVRDRLIFYYACKDFGAAIMEPFNRLVHLLTHNTLRK